HAAAGPPAGRAGRPGTSAGTGGALPVRARLRRAPAPPPRRCHGALDTDGRADRRPAGGCRRGRAGCRSPGCSLLVRVCHCAGDKGVMARHMRLVVGPLLAAAVLVVPVVDAGAARAAPPAAAGAPQCTSPPPPSSFYAAEPWAQRRLDF